MQSMIKLSSKLYDYLRARGIRFNELGYPIVPKEMLLYDYPDEIIPYFCRKQAGHDKKRTALCFFSNDKHIYTRLFNLDNDLDEYHKYMGICGFDLSPRIQWDRRLQRFNILISQMATIYLGLNGIKFYPNFRTGFWDTIPSLLSYPQHSIFSVGALGCAKGYVDYNEASLRAKLLHTMPKRLLIYGKTKPEYEAILHDFDVDYRVYTDFQRSSRHRKDVA